MIRVVFASLLLTSSYFGFSQNTIDTSIEKSVFGVQIGLIGIWAHNELKLSNKLALRSEIALSGVNSTSIRPLLALEPRLYYNLNNRATKGKRIDGNSGNYISLRTSYQFFDTGEIKLVPTWGIRRNIGNHFNYEAGGGIGLSYQKDIAFATYINLRIGYRF